MTWHFSLEREQQHYGETILLQTSADHGSCVLYWLYSKGAPTPPPKMWELMGAKALGPGLDSAPSDQLTARQLSE